MDLLIMVFRKMVKNKWLVISLLIGFIISVALIASIPMYTKGVLQRLLTKELENYQIESGKFPGSYLISVFMDNDEARKIIDQSKTEGKDVFKDNKVAAFYKKRLDNFIKMDNYSKNRVPQKVGLPVLDKLYNYSIEVRRMERADIKKGSDPDGKRFARVQSLSELDKHITLIDGRLPKDEKVDGGVYEAIVPEAALNKLKMVIGQTFDLTDPRTKEYPSIKVRPVGVFTIKDNNDPYWSFFKPQNFSESFLINEDLMKKDFVFSSPTLIQYARWYYAFDYHALKIDKLGNMVGGHNRNIKELNGLHKGIYLDAPSIGIISSYFEKETELRSMMWALNVPVIIMLLLYLFMVSRLIIDHERNEIALLISRGATRWQIVLGYLLEGLILGGIAFIVGPFVGLGLCKLLGASNGFLEFVKRKALPVSMTKAAYIYAAVAIGVSVVTMVIPAYSASKVSIVNYKQRISRRSGLAIWEKTGLDIILLAVSVYGYNVFMQRQNVIQVTGASAMDIHIDPLLFFVPALFILGIGLLTLRIYPWIVKGIYWIGKKIWSPSIYATLIQVGRSAKSYHFLMIFLIMTLSIGLFSATAARTINRNAEEKIYYKNGCDIVLETAWENDAPKQSAGPAPSSAPEQKQDENQDNDEGETGIKRVQYSEPPFLPYTQLPGVENAAKVFQKDAAWIEADDQVGEYIEVMAIEPYDFGNVTWYRSGLLPHHINEYLNLLSYEPSACLISKSISKAYNIKVGDQIRMGWRGTDTAVFTVYGIFNYWPSWNPNKDPSETDPKEPRLMVANLAYVQDHLSLEPYKVWLKLKPGATSAEVYKGIQKKGLPILSLHDSGQEHVKLKNNPLQLAINGSMTLGFLISGVICFLGFLLYWVLSIRSRTLQFGILRGIGLSLKQLVLMMVWEQIFISGAAMAIGVFIGLVSSKIYVPLFQIAYSAASQVPPFRVISFASDRINIYCLIGFTIGLGLLILGYLLSRIKIHQAIKLGED